MGRMLQSWVAAPAAAGAIALAVSAPAHAEVTGVAEAGVGYSDNIGRVPANETDETIGTVGLELDWTERTRRIRGDAVADLSYFEYLDNTYDSELLGTANGSLALGIVPETFQWVFQDTFGQAQADPFSPMSPENREDLNYFSTGPDLTVRLGSTGFGRVFGRWSNTNYEDSPLDADRTTAGVAVGRRASSRSEVSLNAVTESVDFDNPLNTDFDRDSVFLGWDLDASRTNINAQVGYTWLQRDGDDETGNALLDLVITRDISASSVLALTLGTQLGDAGDSLRTQLQGDVVGGGGQITATADPFESRVASLEWRYGRGRTGFSLGVAWNDQDYESATLFDRTRFSYTASFSRQLASTVDFEIRGALEKEEFDNVALDTDETRLAAILNWRAWRTLGLRLTAERYDRDTSNGTGEYQENRAFLTLAYYWGGAEASRR
ncbi:MAG: hypothetical protein ABW171_17320 [Steroidobacter sp.]